MIGVLLWRCLIGVWCATCVAVVIATAWVLGAPMPVPAAAAPTFVDAGDRPAALRIDTTTPWMVDSWTILYQEAGGAWAGVNVDYTTRTCHFVGSPETVARVLFDEWQREKRARQVLEEELRRRAEEGCR